jgi:lysyl-tRNA synthetase class 2
MSEARSERGTRRSHSMMRHSERFPGRLISGVPTTIALTVIGLGLADIGVVLVPGRTARLRALTEVLPVGVIHGASAGTAVAGVLLVMLGHGLRRRKRRAWRAAVALTATTAVLHLLQGLNIAAALASLAVTLLLLALSPQFYAAGDPRGRWRAGATFGVMLVVSFGLGWLLLTARAESVVGHPSVSARWEEIAVGLAGVTGPLRFRGDGTSDLVGTVLLFLGAASVLLPAYLALRPPEPLGVLSPEDEKRVRGLLSDRGADDSLGYFALRRDKSVIFSPTGKSAVAYRVLGGVILASGDPIGDPEAWPKAITEFMDRAREHAWIPAVIGCSERGGEAWVRVAGLRALELGDEAIIDVSEFTLEGRSIRNVRQMVNRVQRAGYVTVVRRVGDLSAEEVLTIREQAAQWRGAETERGFSMALGRFGEPDDRDCVVVTASLGDRLAAVLHFVPWGDYGLSLDLMRRDRSADPGLNEAMIVAAIEAAPTLGVTRLSLNFSVFRSTLERGGRLGAGPVLRLTRQVLLFLSRWFQIESLYRFNAKFGPQWRPRFVCYPRSSLIPRIALAALEAEAFIVWPRLSRFAPGLARRL